MPTLSIDQHVQVEQLTQWPQDTPRTDPDDRTSGPFPNGYGQTPILKRTLDDLEHELRQLGVDKAVLQVDLTTNKIRQRDGLPYQNASPESPAVVLTFEDSEGATQTYPADAFTEWTQNFRAIVKTLESLRSIERYQVGRGDEQYQGYRGIPANVDERIGPEEAAKILVATAGYRNAPNYEERVQKALESEEEAASYLREARAKSHPDKQGGTAAHFKRVQTAGNVLTEYHKGEAA